MRKTWKNLEEFTTEFTKNFNKEVPVQVSDLWYSIIKYADAASECGSEGNSGEFHNDKEEEELGKVFSKAEEVLLSNFAASTGFEPHFVKHHNYVYIGNSGHWYSGAWDFRKMDIVDMLETKKPLHIRIGDRLDLELARQKAAGKKFINDSDVDNLIDKIIKEEIG